jgi:G3E family GTPase
MDPEWLVVETTGIAYPGLMRDNLKGALGMDSRVCVIADASRWKRLRLPMENLLRGQIECADAVLVNKTDLASEESMLEMERDIHEFSSDVPIIRISALSDVPSEIWRKIAGI